MNPSVADSARMLLKARRDEKNNQANRVSNSLHRVKQLINRLGRYDQGHRRVFSAYLTRPVSNHYLGPGSLLTTDDMVSY